MLHWLLSIITMVIASLHIVLLHNINVGTSNPLLSSKSSIKFHPYFSIKDLLGLILVSLLLFTVFLLLPHYLLDSMNCIVANPLISPSEIMPEWQFLPFYAILRAIPNKPIGVVFMLELICINFLLPYKLFSPLQKYVFTIILATFIILGIFGSLPIEEPFLSFCRFSIYFWLFAV